MKKLRERFCTYGSAASYGGYVEMIEMKCLLGLLILANVFKSNHGGTRSLFATDGTGRYIFRGV